MGFVGGTFTSMTRIIPSLAAAAVIVVTLASCASSPDPRPAAPGSDTPTLLPGIDRTEWTCVELTGADGKPIAVTDQPPSLFISAEGRASGFAGVNRYLLIGIRFSDVAGECPTNPLRSGGFMRFM